MKAVTWEWTDRSDEESQHLPAAADVDTELSTSEALEIVSRLAELGCERVTVSGGEIFLRPDWEVIAEAVAGHGIGLVLNCNGSGLRENADRVSTHFQGVSVRLEGTSNIHDMIVARSGSFERAVDGLQALTSLGTTAVGVITTVSTNNVAELDSIRAVVEEIGVRDWLIRMTFASGAMRREGYEAYTLPPADVMYLIKYISDLNRGGTLRVTAGCDIGYNMEEHHLRDAPWAGCPAGIWSAAIESNGDVKPCACLPAEFLEANVRDVDLGQIWRDGFSALRCFDPTRMEGYCRVCPHAYSCACGCVGAAWGSTGTRYDNVYCFHRLANEMQFIREHPEGGVSTDAMRSETCTQDELFRIYAELTSAAI